MVNKNTVFISQVKPRRAVLTPLRALGPQN